MYVSPNASAMNAKHKRRRTTMSNANQSTEAYANEIALALAASDYETSFLHLERAHILAQRNTAKHMYAHWLMLRTGLRDRDYREVLGQLPRILAALVFSR